MTSNTSSCFRSTWQWENSIKHFWCDSAENDIFFTIFGASVSEEPQKRGTKRKNGTLLSATGIRQNVLFPAILSGRGPSYPQPRDAFGPVGAHTGKKNQNTRIPEMNWREIWWSLFQGSIGSRTLKCSSTYFTFALCWWRHKWRPGDLHVTRIV